MFTYMCILCGCDYLKRLRGVGIIKAYNAVNLGRQPAEIFSQLRMKTAITPECVYCIRFTVGTRRAS